MLGIGYVIILIFVMLSVIRCLLFHKVVWFANLNENIVALAVNITSVTIAITQRLVVHFIIRKVIRFSFLSGEPSLCDINENNKIPVFGIILFSASLLFELYIGIKIQKLSCIRFVSVTIGHLYMMGCMYILFNYHDSPIHYVQAIIIMISVQLLYVLRQKDYTIDLLKKCCNVPNITVVPVNESIELNNFGIFVGPQVISQPIIENDVRNPSRNDDLF